MHACTHTHTHMQCFWKTLSQVMSTYTSDNDQDECAADGPLSAVEPPLSGAFWWWIMDWTAQLYRYDPTGSLASSTQACARGRDTPDTPTWRGVRGRKGSRNHSLQVQRCCVLDCTGLVC